MAKMFQTQVLASKSFGSTIDGTFDMCGVALSGDSDGFCRSEVALAEALGYTVTILRLDEEFETHSHCIVHSLFESRIPQELTAKSAREIAEFINMCVTSMPAPKTPVAED